MGPRFSGRLYAVDDGLRVPLRICADPGIDMASVCARYVILNQGAKSKRPPGLTGQ